MPRSDSRRDYRHFPREYTDLLVAFERDGRATLAFSTRREASTARRLLYQFKMLAVSSADADPDDTQARWLVDVFNTVTLRLEPVGAGEAGGGVINGASPSYTVSQADRGPTTLILDSNPVVRAMRAARATVPPPTPLPTSDPHVYGRMWSDNGTLMPSLTDADGKPWHAQGGTTSLENGAPEPVPKAHEPANEPARVQGGTMSRAPASEASALNPCRRPGQCVDAGFGPATCTYCNPQVTMAVALGCRTPAACRSIIHGAPAFCECGDASSSKEEHT
jgi:hypothetical protein